MATVVTAPDGTRWRVGRRWLPWSLRRRSLDLSDVAHMDLVEVAAASDDMFGAVVGVIAGLVAFVLFVLVAIPAVIAALEAALLVVLAALGVLARVLLRRPWIMEVSRVGHPGRVAWKVVGWRRSNEAMAEIARRLQAGERDLELRLPGVTRA